jgi:hypothetical protein
MDHPLTGKSELPHTMGGDAPSASRPGTPPRGILNCFTSGGFMFGNGDVPIFGGSLNFFADLPDGRRFGVVIVPDEQHEDPLAKRAFAKHHGQPITPAVVRSYLPDYAGISWRLASPTFFGRTEEWGTNGKFRVGLKAGGEGPGAVTLDEMRNWFAANVYGSAP